MLVTGCHAFRRKRMYSGVTLTRKMRAVSQQPHEEKATAHRGLVEVSELPARLELSTQFCCLDDKDTDLAADVKGGSTWKTHSQTWFSQADLTWCVDRSLVLASNHPVQGCTFSNIQHLNTGKSEGVLLLCCFCHTSRKLLTRVTVLWNDSNTSRVKGGNFGGSGSVTRSTLFCG